MTAIKRSTSFVFDMPSPFARDDMLAFAPHADALRLVLAQEVTARESLAPGKELIEGFNVIGTVLNRSSVDIARHPYYGYVCP